MTAEQRAKICKRMLWIIPGMILAIIGDYCILFQRKKCSHASTLTRRTRRFLSFVLLFTGLILPASATGQTVTCLDGEPNRNVGDNDYSSGYWFHPVKSYLSVEKDGSCVRAFARKLSMYSAYSEKDDVLVVEWYTREGKLINTKTHPFLLPSFGGFYFGETYNYAYAEQQRLQVLWQYPHGLLGRYCTLLPQYFLILRAPLLPQISIEDERLSFKKSGAHPAKAGCALS